MRAGRLAEWLMVRLKVRPKVRLPIPLMGSLMFALAGCAVPPPVRLAEPRPPSHWGLQTSAPDRAPAPAASSARGAEAMPGPAWWRELGDPLLDQLIEQALRDAPSLAVAQARVDQAGALAAAAGSALAPQVTGGADLVWQRYSANGLVPPPIGGAARIVASAQVGLGWSPDLPGWRAAAAAAAQAQVQGVQAEAAGVAVALATQVARGYVALGRAVAQRRLATQELAARGAKVLLAQRRVAAGLEAAASVERAQADEAMARSRLLQLDEQIMLGRRQLAVLCAQRPDALDAIEPASQAWPLAGLPPHLGADLLGRRTDVAAARWRVESALDDLQVARAQFYPDLNLSAFAGLGALGLSRWLQPGSLQAGVGPALRLPLFDGERLAALHRVRQAQVREAVAAYDATVLAAVHEAGDAIARLRAAQLQLDEQGRLLGRLTQALALEQRREQAGLAGATPALEARLALLDAQRQAAAWRAAALDARLALVQALGGGWSDPAHAAPKMDRP